MSKIHQNRVWVVFLEPIFVSVKKLQTELRPIATWMVSIPLICDRSQHQSQKWTSFPNLLWFRSWAIETDRNPTGIGRKIGLSTRRPWDHLLVSVSVHLVSVSFILVLVTMTTDRSQVIIHNQNDWNLSWFRSQTPWYRSQMWDRYQSYWSRYQSWKMSKNNEKYENK